MWKYFQKTELLIGCLFIIQLGTAQDVEPRRWSVFPTKSNIVGAAYAYTFGDVLFDPLLETEDVRINFSTVFLNYIKPFRIANKYARLDVNIPYFWQSYEGLLRGEPASAYRNGFGDARIRFSINFTGAPPGNAKEIMEYSKANPVNTTFGASVSVTLPTGQYFDELLLNIGNNQVLIRPQVGFVHSWSTWSYELTGSVYFFTNNNNFFGGSTRKQDPILALQTHLIKALSPKTWASVSVSYGLGGESEVNGVSSADFRTNILSALSAGTRITKMQNLKLVYLNSTTLKDIGSNTHSFILGWTHLFL